MPVMRFLASCGQKPVGSWSLPANTLVSAQGPSQSAPVSDQFVPHRTSPCPNSCFTGQHTWHWWRGASPSLRIQDPISRKYHSTLAEATSGKIWSGPSGGRKRGHDQWRFFDFKKKCKRTFFGKLTGICVQIRLHYIEGHIASPDKGKIVPKVMWQLYNCFL